jgi:lipopolysaccharide export LptBFGC system permease protein LptF
VTLALTVPAYYSVGAYRQSVPLLPALLRLLPQALAISVSISLMLGISFSLGGRAVSGRMKAAVVVIAVVCSMATFLNIGWLTPAANQSFRLFYAARLGIDPATVRPGLPELSLGELRHKVHSEEAVGTHVSSLDLELAYYARWVIALLPLVLTVFMLSIVTGRAVRSWALGLIAFVTLLGYYLVMYLARTLAFAGHLPASVAVWTPNIVVATLAGALMLFPIRRPAEAGRY